MDRRRFVLTALGAGTGALAFSRVLQAQQRTAQGALPPMTVYKSASCGCCSEWVAYARKSGFTVKTVDTEDLASVKAELGIPPRLQSCHTVVMGPYLLEGHVPAEDVRKMFATKPKVRGLAVPGMPLGAPGMEQGSPADYQRYDVVAFTAAGAMSVFSTHGPAKRG
ncbi:MAG: DUF411 domain-containing protein [Gemmatimonadota bacterium]|nr:DUF411 domain-containing protein [Gemmatimonadota bacterium]